MRRHGAPFRIALNLPSVGCWDDGLSVGRIDDPGLNTLMYFIGLQSQAGERTLTSTENSLSPRLRAHASRYFPDARLIGIGAAVARGPPSRPGELHPEPLTEPDLNLSAYPARATHGRLPSSTDIEFLRLPVDSNQYG
jgi:hypothetical protein